ncbi:hypothetical protein BN946_scf184942.g11 [Trametes cinnabarina]|uniref:LysM domain-containing protein n=1 Tax=Pycnoporus cinnabarinus TaxID=5643 RepID=A0A060S7I5_PYCCI|nr:hypothetical protein BN946_scf184942.g11 [Trametes cinnabarina]
MFSRSSFIVAIVAAVALHGAYAQEPNCARNYTVVLGDTCDEISAKTNTSTYQLATVNADKIDAACDNLAVGELLCLGIVGQDCDVVDVVQSGDSCAAIADDAGTTLDILLANNPNVNSDCTNIYPGESSFVERPVKQHSAQLESKRHDRIVLNEHGHSLHEETSLQTAFSFIRDVIQCLVFLHYCHGWVHCDVSTVNILVVGESPDQLRGVPADSEYGKEYDADETTHINRTGTEHFTAIEVDAHAYNYLPMDDIEQQPLSPQPFRYHPLNDWESVWWVCICMVINRVVKSRDKSKSLEKQRKIAEDLFYNTDKRLQLFKRYILELDSKIESAAHPDVSKIMRWLRKFRFELYGAYIAVEKDISCYPDAKHSVRLIGKRALANMARICDHLKDEPQSSLPIEPIPPVSIDSTEAIIGDKDESDYATASAERMIYRTHRYVAKGVPSKTAHVSRFQVSTSPQRTSIPQKHLESRDIQHSGRSPK